MIAGIGGAVAVVLLVSLPRLVERFDPLGLHHLIKRTTADAHEQAAPGGEGKDQ